MVHETRNRFYIGSEAVESGFDGSDENVIGLKIKFAN